MHNLRTFFFLLFFGFLPNFTFALGGDAGQTRSIPLPEKNYSVVITDVQNIQTSADRVSWEGKVYLQGRRGEALTTIPFEKISQIEMIPQTTAPPGSIATKVTLRSGESVQLHVKGTSKAYGETSFGKFEIYLQDVRKILFN